MKVPTEIIFRGMNKRMSIEELVHEQISRLEKLHDQLISCRVAVEAQHRSQQTGRPYRVRISLRVPPGHELIAERSSSTNDTPENVPQVVRQAFDALRRQLQELVERQRAEVKPRTSRETMAFVVRLFPEDGYGFLKTPDGEDLYFHRNSVLHNDFERLAVGTGVRFTKEIGEKGAQASTVQIVDKPGVRVSTSDEAAPEVPLGWQQ